MIVDIGLELIKWRASDSCDFRSLSSPKSAFDLTYAPLCGPRPCQSARQDDARLIVCSMNPLPDGTEDVSRPDDSSESASTT